MEKSKIEKLKSIKNLNLNMGEIAEIHENIGAGESVCVEICSWVLKQAAGEGSCAAGEAALTGIFTAAEIVFFPEGDVILPELEVVVDAGWGAICSQVGVDAIRKDAKKYAKQFCSEI